MPKTQDAQTSIDCLNLALLAASAEREAIEAIRRKLEDNTITDPSAVARDLATIASDSIDAYLTLKGRPTQIIASPAKPDTTSSHHSQPAEDRSSHRSS